VWNTRFSEEPIRADEARRIIDAVIEERAGDVELVKILKTAVAELSGLHPRGNCVLVRLRPRITSRTFAVSPRYTPSQRNPLPLPTGPPPRIEEPVISEEIAAAQAATLRRAAELGTPFCAECARAAAKAAAAAGP
jgi:hypothetical protein